MLKSSEISALEMDLLFTCSYLIMVANIYWLKELRKIPGGEEGGYVGIDAGNSMRDTER